MQSCSYVGDSFVCVGVALIKKCKYLRKFKSWQSKKVTTGRALTLTEQCKIKYVVSLNRISKHRQKPAAAASWEIPEPTC